MTNNKVNNNYYILKNKEGFLVKDYDVKSYFLY